MRTRLVVAALLLTVGACATLRPTSTDGLVGSYAVTGANDRGGTYTGRVDVIESDGLLHIRWQLASGEEAFGIGMLSDGVLAVSFASKGQLGTGVYHRTREGWVGFWSVTSQPGRQPERWDRRDLGPILPSHPHPAVEPDGVREHV